MTGSLQRGTPAARLYVRLRRSGRRLRRSRRAGVAAAALAILAVAFAVGAWVVVPLGVGAALDRWAAAAPGRGASSGSIAVNPLTLKVTLHDTAFEAPGISASASRIVLDFGLGALLGGVVVLDELAVDGLRVRIAGESPAGTRALVLPDVPLAIARASVDGGRIEWLDPAGEPLVLDGVTARALDVARGAAARPARFEIDVRNVLGGVVRIEGELVPDELIASGRVLVENVDLAPLAARFVAAPRLAGMSSGAADFEWRGDAGTLRFGSATLETLEGRLAWPDGRMHSAARLEAAGEANLAGGEWRFSGRVDLLRPSLRDAGGRVWLEARGLAALESQAALRRTGADARSAALELASPASIGTLALAAPRATVVLGAADDADGNRAVEAALALLSGPRAVAGRIELEGGVLEIVDAGLEGARPSLLVRDVEGVIERATGETAVVAELAAAAGDAGKARVWFRAGLGGDDMREVTLELDAVPAEVFSEHARRLAGYALAGGTIDAAIDYRAAEAGIEGDARVGGRRLVIERTSDPAAAADVDLALALALLEDAHGVAATAFDFAAPGGGAERADRVLAAAIVAHLEAVAAEPFAALGAAAGVDAAALAAVPFPPGEAGPAESGTLAALAEALLARPRVGVRVAGVADGGLDRDALAAQQVELHVTLATAGPTLVARPQPVDFGSPRHQDILDEFAGERLSAEERETIASYFTRTPDGRVVEEERSDYYRAIFAALVEHEPIPQNGIERLARYRARAIADALIAQGVEETRIEIAPAVVRRSAASDARIEVPLDVFALSNEAENAEPPPAASLATGDPIVLNERRP